MIANTPSVFKFCPQCGSKGFSQTGNRAMSCSECKFEYYFNTAAAVTAIVFNNDGQVMLTRRAFEPQKGKLDLPGGFVEFNETAEEALKRELQEELGAEIIQMDYLGTFPNQYSYSTLTVHTLDNTYTVQLKSLKLKAMDDVASYSFWKLSDIPMDELAFDSTKQTILKLKER